MEVAGRQCEGLDMPSQAPGPHYLTLVRITLCLVFSRPVPKSPKLLTALSVIFHLFPGRPPPNFVRPATPCLPASPHRACQDTAFLAFTVAGGC